MSSTASARSESVSFLARASASQIAVRQLAREIQDLRRQGEPAPVRVVLARHPELAKDKSLVIELANEGLCQRAETGEKPDPEQFARQFPGFHPSVHNIALPPPLC